MTHQAGIAAVRRRSTLGDYGEKPLRRYKLTAQLSAGGSASALFVSWDTTDDEYDPTAQEFTLYSFSKATGNEGDEGYCWYSSDRQQWEALVAMISTGPDVRWVTAVLPEALTSQAFVGGCPIVNDWYSNAGVTSITAYNELGFQADAGSEFYAAWRPSDQEWVIIQCPCPTGSS